MPTLTMFPGLLGLAKNRDIKGFDEKRLSHNKHIFVETFFRQLSDFHLPHEHVDAKKKHSVYLDQALVIGVDTVVTNKSHLGWK